MGQINWRQTWLGNTQGVRFSQLRLTLTGYFDMEPEAKVMPLFLYYMLSMKAVSLWYCFLCYRMLVPVQTVVDQMGPDVLNMRDEKGHTPAHWACLGGHTAILRYLLEHKAVINEPSNNELGARPIHWACVNGHIAIVDILVQAGVSLDVTDNKGCTSLIVAAQYGQTMLAGYLMGKGARLQMVDRDGDTSLHWACFKG